MTIRRINRGKNHSYSIDGTRALGVTTALSKGMPKPALPYWSAKAVAEYVGALEPETLHELIARLGRPGLVNFLKGIPWAERDAAAGKGTEVHELAEKLIHGQPVEVPEHLTGHVAAAVKFMDQWQIRPLLTEAVVGSYKWNFAGTLDLVGELPDGRRILFDYKTSKSGIFPETALQLAAYRHAEVYVGTDGVTEIPMGEVGITEAAAVWVREDGYDVIPLQTGPEVYQAFLHVAYVARVADQMGAWVGDPVYPS